MTENSYWVMSRICILGTEREGKGRVMHSVSSLCSSQESLERPNPKFNDGENNFRRGGIVNWTNLRIFSAGCNFILKNPPLHAKNPSGKGGRNFTRLGKWVSSKGGGGGDLKR